MKGYKTTALAEEQIKNEGSLLAQCQAVADMKFTYVVSCQQYGIQKRSGDRRATDILRLMTKYDYLYLNLSIGLVFNLWIQLMIL